MLDAPASGAEFLAWMVGGVALLVWGMRMVRTGVQRAYGERLRAFVGGWLATRGHGWAAGLLVTLLLQSSTATCLLISAFAGRALVPLGIALAVMLGADVGTTLVAMIFTLDVGALAPLLCAVGTIAFLVGRDRKRRSRARAVLGLGLILLSLQIIVGSSAVLRESETAAIVLGSLTDEPVVALLLSAGLTWVMHSSLAMVLFVASLAAAGVLSTPLLLMLVLGANVGGALVPYTATLAEPLAARRVAGGNALFKLIGAALILPVLEPLAQALAAFELSGTQLAVAAHFGFNAAVSLLFLPALGAMPALLARLVRPRPDETGAYGAQGTAMEHLADSDLDTPKSALANAERVAVNAAIVAEGMLSAVESGLRENDEDALGGLGQQDDLIDDMHERVKRYLTRLRRVPLDEAESRRANEILTYMANIEHAGDIIEKTLKDVARKKARRGLAFSERGRARSTPCSSASAARSGCR